MNPIYHPALISAGQPTRSRAGITYWRGLGLCGLALCSFGAMAQEPPSGDSESKWGAHIDFEAKPGSKRTLGEADLFLPLAQDERTLVFGNLRGRMDDNSSREGNLGLGVRRMLPKGWNLGTYGYFDRRRTDEGNYFNQATVGAEALGSDWDFRANGYIPLGDRTRDLGTTGGDTTAALSGTQVLITTAGTVTREERAFGGFDAEVGWRLPVFDAEDPNQLRVYAGGYRFGDSVVKVAGPRMRVELAMAQVPGLWEGSQLFLGAETQDDSERGSQSFASIRIRIPLGGNPEKARQFTTQERRMTAPIMRDVDVVTQARVASTTPELVETATAMADGKAFTVLSSATTTGAALPGAVLAAPAAAKIILSGTFNTTATTWVLDGRSLMAGSIPVRSASGRTATLVTSATIAGTNNVGNGSYVVRLQGNNTLSGLTITGTRNDGAPLEAIHLDNTAGNITVSNNTITATQTGNANAFGISAGAITNLVVSGNTITATGTGTQNVRALSIGLSTVTVSGNTLSASGGAPSRAVYVGSSTINAGSTGNTISAGVCSNGGGNTGSIGFTNGSTCP